ncbi:protein E30 [Elephant endotheliotropic herpesvirus 3A]|uniref:Protein E30 n=1 Tax=Elephant endotheliotropic herpesvirus 3A TaxID=1329409 RepID=A0A866VSQ7_9BETA|nr:protein E30 [Elephant endotheliotropic herpesvirus 3A]QOE74404.1 protein E30 [Elephant endotheliotropic herpesvirus 3A]
MKRYKNRAHALRIPIAVPPVAHRTYQSLILITLFVTTMEISKEEDIDFCFDQNDECDVQYADPEDNDEENADEESEDGDSVDHDEDERMEEEKYKYKDLPPPGTDGPPVCLDLTVMEPEMVTANIKYHEVCDEYGKRGYSFQGLIYYDPQDDEDDDEYDDFDEDDEELTAM